MKLCRLFLLVSLLLLQGTSRAEVILVPFNDDTVPTAYWPKPNSVATLIFLPGGDGSFGMALKTNPQPTWLLKTLSQTDTEKSIDLVFMDSRTSLGWKNGDVGPRFTSGHIERIKVVVNFYRQKKSQPIFLLGHSNGAISVAEFLNQTTEHQNSLGGVIFSGSRNETHVKSPLNIPVMVLHHKDDPNSWTRPANAQALFTALKAKNSASTEMALVQGGFDEGNPSTSGRHMYAGSVDQAGHLVSDFILSHLK